MDEKTTLSGDQLKQICASRHWQTLMADALAQHDSTHWLQLADRAFEQLTEADWLEAFHGHPMIGNIDTLKKKYAHGRNLSAQEQGLVKLAAHDIVEELHELNQVYLDKFGFIFIVCASGKTAAEMLALLKARLPNTREQELPIAAQEQRKISHIRMEAYL